MDIIKPILLNLEEIKSMEYLSLIYFLSSEQINILNAYIIKYNINTQNISYKVYIFNNKIREKLSNNEIDILTTLKNEYIKYYVLIYNFYTEDDENEYFNLFLENLDNSLSNKNNIHDIISKNKDNIEINNDINEEINEEIKIII